MGKEINQWTPITTQAREDDGFHGKAQVERDSENWMDSRNIWKRKLTGLADGLDVGGERGEDIETDA